MTQEQTSQERVLDEHWWTLCISVRAERAIERLIARGHSITTVRDVAALTEKQLLALHGCGPHSVADIQQELQRYGLHLGWKGDR